MGRRGVHGKNEPYEMQWSGLALAEAMGIIDPRQKTLTVDSRMTHDDRLFRASVTLRNPIKQRYGHGMAEAGAERRDWWKGRALS